MKPTTAYILWRRYILETPYRNKLSMPTLIQLLEDHKLIELEQTAGGLRCLPTKTLSKPAIFPLLDEYLQRSVWQRCLYRYKAAQRWARLKSNTTDAKL